MFVSLDICYIYFFHAIIVICGVIAIDGVTGISLVVSVLVKFEKKIGDGEWWIGEPIKHVDIVDIRILEEKGAGTWSGMQGKDLGN